MVAFLTQPLGEEVFFIGGFYKFALSENRVLAEIFLSVVEEV